MDTLLHLIDPMDLPCLLMVLVRIVDGNRDQAAMLERLNVQ